MAEYKKKCEDNIQEIIDNLEIREMRLLKTLHFVDLKKENLITIVLFIKNQRFLNLKYNLLSLRKDYMSLLCDSNNSKDL